MRPSRSGKGRVFWRDLPQKQSASTGRVIIVDTTAFEEAYVSEYGKIEDEARHRTVIAAELFRAVMEGGKAFKVSAQGAAASLIAE